MESPKVFFKKKKTVTKKVIYQVLGRKTNSNKLKDNQANRMTNKLNQQKNVYIPKPS